MHSRATDRRSASKCQGKWPDQTLDPAFRLPEVLVAVSTSRLSCKRAGKTRTFDAGLGFIWRISDQLYRQLCRWGNSAMLLRERLRRGMRTIFRSTISTRESRLFNARFDLSPNYGVFGR